MINDATEHLGGDSVMMGKMLVVSQLVLVLLMVIGMLGLRFQILPFKLAFGGFALALALSALVSLVALLVLALSLGPVDTQIRMPSATAFALGAVPLVILIATIGTGFKVPPIHDISTDLDDNIAFVHAGLLRTAEHNSLAFPTPKELSAQRKFYVNIAPLLVPEASLVAYNRSLDTAKHLGWTITYEAPENLHFEAFQTTPLFGFVDDIAVRVKAEGSKSRIDMRSVSRVGVSDLGANGKRIRRFQHAYSD